MMKMRKFDKATLCVDMRLDPGAVVGAGERTSVLNLQGVQSGLQGLQGFNSVMVDPVDDPLTGSQK